MSNSQSQIPDIVIFRLPQYLAILTILSNENAEVVSSQELGARLQMTPAQIRKDLSYFGKFGKQGKGYNVGMLMEELRKILGLDQEWNMALIGVGRIGKALLDYGKLALQSFKIVAAFDIDTRIIGKRIGGVTIQDISELADTIKTKDIKIGVVAVPPSQVQKAVDSLVKCGIKAILNYYPIATRVPPDVRVRKVDPMFALETMTYYLRGLTSP
ncbi:MAG: redox-sensing transcriptional repressor Rex [Chloroflexota bacterium]|nr:redox-sensing transcriptional repressor Rex [Chloroflexota bacterium]